MDGQKNKDFNRIEQLIVEGKFIEALQVIEALEKKKPASNDYLNYQLLKSTIMIKIGEYSKAIDNVENVLKEDQQNKLLAVDFLINKAAALSFLGKFDESLVIINQGEETLEKLAGRSNDLYEEIERKEGYLLHYSGRNYWKKGQLDRALNLEKKAEGLFNKIHDKRGMALVLNGIGLCWHDKGDLNRSLDYYKQSLAIREKLGNKLDIAYCLNNIGEIYRNKGESNRALEYYRRSLAIRTELGNQQDTAVTLENIGLIYWMNNDLDEANHFLEQGLKLFEITENALYIAEILFYLVSVAVDKTDPDPDLANYYLQKLHIINDREDSRVISQFFRLSEALILKTSLRQRYKFRALEMFDKIANEKVTLHELKIVAMLNSCELLLEELRQSGNEEVLGEVKAMTTRLRKIAKQQHSHYLLAESYLLQSKLALVEADINKARQYLSLAQFTAEEKNLQRLAKKISSEHDSLLNQLEKWEEAIERASISERAELTHLEELVGRMAKMKTDDLIDTPKEEDPVMFLVLANNGVTIFSKDFFYERVLNEQIIGGFLSAINAFSSQIFSHTLDRIKVADYTLVVKSEEPLLFCYVFKGQSYSALHKLNQFIEALQDTTTTIWQELIQIVGDKRVFVVTASVRTSLEELAGNVFPKPLQEQI